MKIKLMIIYILILLVGLIGCSTEDGNNDVPGDEGAENEWHGIKSIKSSGIGNYHSLAVDGKDLYVSFYDRVNHRQQFTKSTDGGATWPASNIKTILSIQNVGEFNSILQNGNNVYISYFNDTASDMMFAKSTDGGVTWPDGNVKTVDANNRTGYESSMSVVGSNVYVSYSTFGGGLRFAKSTDGGVTWPAGNIKTVESSYCYATSTAVDGNNVYICYYDGSSDDLMLAKSTDGGVTWPAGNIKTIDTTGGVYNYASMGIDGNNIYVSYYDDQNDDLKFAKSTDGGATWPAGNIKIIDSTDDSGRYVSMAIDGNNVYVSYFYYALPYRQLKFVKSTDSGVTWPTGNIKTVSIGSIQGSTSIIAKGNKIYICYDGLGSLWLAKSIDYGVTW